MTKAKTTPRRVALTGGLANIGIKGEPAALAVHLLIPLDDQNIDAVLLLADWKRHGGPLAITLEPSQLALPEA